MDRILSLKARPRPLFGILAALAALVLCPLPAGLAVAALFLWTGFFRIPEGRPVLAFVLNGLWGIACIALSCAMPAALFGFRFFDLQRYRLVMNFICAAGVYGFCLVITGRLKPAVILASGALMVMATVNFFVFQFRGHELKPSDFLYIRTAANVVGQYRFALSPRMACCWLIWLWSVFFLGTLPRVPAVFTPARMRLGALAASALCLGAFLCGGRDLRGSSWANEGTAQNGFYLNFCLEFRDSFPKKPAGYSADAVAALAAAYETAPAPAEKKPNIIVIMSESFADLSVLGSAPKTNVPVTPFIDSLRDNTVRGHALTSIFGGTTANAEFEVLTGGSMALMPPGTVPYVQHISGPVFSLAHYLKSLGYRTEATHPFHASGYDRQKVYPLLGFEEISFLEDYPDAPLVRQFVSDAAVYQRLLDRQAAEDGPLFQFAITMQNHSGYAYQGEHYEKTVSLDSGWPQAEQYLSVLRETDRATREFLTALEETPEDTVVLFFGDHLPDLEWEFFEELHGGPPEGLEGQMQRHTVPFFLWANFDIPEEEAVLTSLNYLSPRLLNTAGLPLPPCFRFLEEAEAVIPAVNALGYYSLAEQRYLPLEEAAGAEGAWLKRYGLVQYNSLFDRKNRSEIFFGRYLPEN